MPCTIKNPSNYNLTDLEPHVHGMYDHFDQKYGFQKPPVMVFDSDPGNQSKVLGKTAYYDPQSLEIHVFVDGRHPKDVLRSIAHELIHHRQNMEGRLDTGGYSGPGYYLENDELKEVEHEAMLEGNATMREYEDTVKYKNIEENKKMSLKEWKNNELNKQLLKKFGILKENKKPDFPDVDGDGDREEPISKAQKEKKAKDGDDKKASKPKKGEVPPQLQKHVKGKKEEMKEIAALPPEAKRDDDKEVNELASHGLEGYPKRDDDKEEMEEGRNNPRTTNADKFAGHEDRYQADRIHEESDYKTGGMPSAKQHQKDMQTCIERLVRDGESPEFAKKLCAKNQPQSMPQSTPMNQSSERTKLDGEKTFMGLTAEGREKGVSSHLQEAIKKIARAKRVKLNGKRIK